MGWLSFLMSNALFTSILLGGLKHEKAATIDVGKIHNDVLRTSVSTGVQLGESIYIALKQWADNVRK